MSGEPDLRAAVAAAALGGHDEGSALLDALVATARSAFGAAACSVMAFDPATGELEWLAADGAGADGLVGRRIPASGGLAGWVRASGEALVLEDVRQDPRFAADVAASTGYVPRSMMVAPLLEDDETATGVLSVLDRTAREGEALAELELLGRFAAQAAIVLRTRRAGVLAASALGRAGPEAAAVARLAEVVLALPAERRPAALALLDALGAVLRPG